MQEEIKLEDITDINMLKALKSDRYDLIEQLKRQIETAAQEIGALTARVEQLKSEAPKVAKEDGSSEA